MTTDNDIEHLEVIAPAPVEVAEHIDAPDTETVVVAEQAQAEEPAAAIPEQKTEIDESSLSPTVQAERKAGREALAR